MINSLSSIWRNRFTGFENSAGKSAKSGTFADLFQGASQQVKANEDAIQVSAQSSGDISTITEKGKKSAGNSTLTDVQKQYLRDKFCPSDPSKLSDSGLNQLLTDLTNQGVLSYQDYLRADARPTPPPGVVIITSRKSNDSFLSLSKNYGDYFRQVIEGEKEEADYIKKNYGIDAPASYSDCIEAHQRIESVLNSL